MGIGGIAGYAEGIESAHGFQAIKTFDDEDKVRMERSDYFKIRIDAAADLGLLLGIGGVIAKIGVADETILEAQGVDGFGEAGSERNDAQRGKRDAHGAPGFINDFAGGRNGRGKRPSSTSP